MAVEIPVVINIDQAFKDAAQRVPGASAPLKASINQLSEDLTFWKDQVKTVAAGSKDFEFAARQVAEMEQALRLLNNRMNEYGTNAGSIRRLSGELETIRAQFEMLGTSKLFDASGKLSADAQKLQQDYAKVATDLDRVNSILTQEYEKQRRIREEAERQAEAQRKHMDALSSTGSSIASLTERAAAWRKELNNIDLSKSSSSFSQVAKNAEMVSQQLARVVAQAKILGTETGSIDQLNARMQELNRQFNLLSDSNRRGARGQAVIDEYLKVDKLLNKEIKSLQQIAQRERKIEEIIVSTANKRKYENAVLSSTANTMHRLSEQARILQERLERARFGTKYYEELKQKLTDVQSKMLQVQGSVNGVTTAMRSQSAILRSLTSYATMYVSAFGAIRFVKQLRDVTAELEYQRVALGHLIQDVSKGNALFEQIKEAAIESPFRIKDLVTYTKQLAAYRVEQNELFYTTKRLADISAGLGVDMNRLILAYGQVRAASVLRGQELRQFTEAGIPLVQMLAEKFTDLRGEMVSTADVFKLISQRAVPFSMISEIFEDLTEKGGMFYKMQEEQAKTLKGRWEKLKDAYDIALQSVGDTESFQRANDAVLSGLRFIADNLRVIIKLVDSAVISWAAYNAVLWLAGSRTKLVATAEQAAAIATAVRSKTLSGIVVKILGQAAAEKALTAATTQATIGTNMLSRALGRLKIALLTNPWAVAGAAILTVILALTRYKKATDDATEATNSLNRAVSELNNANRQYERISGLIKKYEELSKVEERNAAQNETLGRTVKKLAAEYPDLKEKLENNNLPLKERLALVEKLNEEEAKRIKAIKDEKEAELNAAESRLSRAEKNLETKQQAKNEATDWYNETKATLDSLSADGQSGRSWFMRVLLGPNDYDETEAALDRLEKHLDKTEEDYNKNKEAVDGLKDSIEELRKELYGVAEDAPELEKGWKTALEQMQLDSRGAQLFTPEQLEGWHRLYDVSNDLEKEWKKLKVDLEGLKAAMPKPGDPNYLSWLEDIYDVTAKINGMESIRDKFNFTWKTGGGNGGKTSYTQDPFIAQMKERMKFMQDFKKGYEEFNKYLSKSDALAEQASIMEKRGLSLGVNVAEQKRAAEELADWYAEAREKAFAQAKTHGATGTIDSFLSQEIKETGKNGKALKDFQKLLQSLWDAETEIRTDKKKKEIEDALKKLSDEIKRSETAKNFFNNILDLTGDEKLAGNLALSVYGDPGDEIGKRIKDSIEGALTGLDLDKTSGIGKTLLDAAENMDFREVMKNIDQLPEKLQETVKNAAATIEKYNVDTANSYVKLLMQFDEIGQKRRTIEDKADKDIATLREGLALELKAINEKMEGEEKEAAEKAAKAREEAAEEGVNRQRELDLLRTSRDYRLFFETIGTISLASARKIAKAERDIVSAQFEAGEINLNQYLRALNRIDEQLKKYEDERNPIVTYLTKGLDGLFEKLKQTDINLRAFAGNLKDDEGNFSLPEGLKEAVNTIGKIFGGSIFGENIKGRKNVFDQLKEELKENADAWEETLDRVAEKLGEMGSDMSRGFGWAGFWVSFAGGAVKSFDQIAQKSKNTEGEVKEGWNAVGKFIMTSAAGMLVGNPLGAGVLGQLWDVDDAWERFTSLNEKAMSGFEKFKSGDIIGAIADNIEGWSEVFGKNTKAIDRQIKEQSDNIEELKYQYDRLGVAIEDAFGSDYIYNFQKQVEVLQAQAEAYRKQAELEQQKGDKKRDDEKIKDYKNSAREIEDQIKDMQGQLAEFFTGTDLTSAARDFAQAWIEAYKEFGSTTDAMKEKFDDMIENMVVNSLAASLIQNILGPVFDKIEKAAKDGDLTAQEIGEISEQLPGLMGQIDNALGTMVSQLSAAGINLRQQAGQFTGISRDFAGASEESVLGLSAGINTANFYMSYLPSIGDNVAALRAYIVGDSAETVRTTASEGPTYEDQMLGYAANLPMMRDDMYAIRSLLEKVIKPVGTAYYVSVR